MYFHHSNNIIKTNQSINQDLNFVISRDYTLNKHDQYLPCGEQTMRETPCTRFGLPQIQTMQNSVKNNMKYSLYKCFRYFIEGTTTDKLNIDVRRAVTCGSPAGNTRSRECWPALGVAWRSATRSGWQWKVKQEVKGLMAHLIYVS